MDLDSDRKDDTHSHVYEKEAAPGSGGLFGDLSHENKPGDETHPIQPPSASEPAQATEPDASRQTRGDQQPAKPEVASGTSQSSASALDQPAAAGAEAPRETLTYDHASTPDQRTAASDTTSQQFHHQDGAFFHHQLQPIAEASSSQAALPQPLQPQSDNTADHDQAAPQLAEEQDLIPDEIDETDSAIGSDTQSTTTTLSESVFAFRTEHGRTYHAYKDGKYIFPNDEREADRLDLQHHLFRITYANRLFFAPLNKPRRCLDVGTGTGIWAVDFADDFPECQVVGIDLSPVDLNSVPPNLKFVIDDAEDMWIYPDKFDFIHARLMAGCFADWPNFFRQAYENLEPGGWLELQDYGLPVKSADGSTNGTDILRWGELLCEAARNMGRPMGSDCADLYLTWMEQAGFVDIQQRMFMWPSNGWPKDPFMKELGRWNQMNILDGLEGFCLALLTRGLGWRKEEVDVFVARVSSDFRNRRIHAYFPMPVVFARKPFEGGGGF